VHKRVAAVLSATLFCLLALVAAVVTAVHDRDFPQALGAHSALGLDFADSELTDRDALAELTSLDAQWDVGLVKIMPDLAGDADRRVFVTLGDRDLPVVFRWFSGTGAGRVVGSERLANSPPDGSYLVTGDTAGLAALAQRLRDAGVRVTRTDASVADSLRFSLGEGGFRTAVLAACALGAALALFWLSMNTRSRALRVLGGSPALRIQAQDLGGFAAVLLLTGAAVAAGSAACVALLAGPSYVGVFVRALLALQLAVVAASMLVALAMSAVAWPSAVMLATRQPAVRSLRSAAAVVQAATFVLIVAAAGPAWSAQQRSAAVAAETAQWTNLAEQVAVRFAMAGDDMSRLEPRVGDLVADAEAAGALAFSYTFTEDQWQGDFGGYSAVAFVNQAWLDLLAREAPPGAMAAVPSGLVQDMLVRLLGEQLTLNSRDNVPGAAVLAGLEYQRPAGGFRLPVSEGGSGSLQFRDDVLVAVVPSVHATFNDGDLTSMMSSKNVLFSGVTATRQLLEHNGLGAGDLRKLGVEGDLNVVYVAEDGILIAQFTAYMVRLMTLALAGLAVAFSVAAAITALITSLLHAQRDFPLRLSGRSWPRIIRGRAARDLAAGAALVGVVALIQRPSQAGALLAAALLGALVVPLSHLLAARWCFAGVVGRRI
jgi:hypothetical protein